jgi:hypothetical protein
MQFWDEKWITLTVEVAREWGDWDEGGAGIGFFMIKFIIKEFSAHGFLHIPYPLAKKYSKHNVYVNILSKVF